MGQVCFGVSFGGRGNARCQLVHSLNFLINFDIPYQWVSTLTFRFVLVSTFGNYFTATWHMASGGIVQKTQLFPLNVNEPFLCCAVAHVLALCSRVSSGLCLQLPVL